MQQQAFIYNPDALHNQKEKKVISVAKAIFPPEFCIESKAGVDLIAHFQKLEKKGVNHLIISSGDGTISKILTALYHVYGEMEFPKLTILPSGNTNLISYDVGRKRYDKKYLLDLVRSDKNYICVRRNALKISFPGTDRLPQLGMFGGAGSFEKAVSCSRNEVEHLMPHEIAIVGTIIKSVLKIVFSQKERNAWYRGVRMPWAKMPPASFPEDMFFTLITSLEKLPFGLWPFWNYPKLSQKGFYFLRISAFPKWFLFAILPLISGKIPAWMKKTGDYQSGKLSQISAHLETNFILDGEFIEPSENGEILIELGPPIEFLS